MWSKWRDSELRRAKLGNKPHQNCENEIAAGGLNASLARHEEQNSHRAFALWLFWSKWRDSNSRPPVPETGALPPALHLVGRNHATMVL